MVQERMRSRALGIAPGVLSPGTLNAITDVSGVCVGHLTVIEEDDIRTGATAILPHAGNLYQDKVPAGLAVGNGYGKLMGSTQVLELGEIETPILLTNTLAVPRAADAILDWTLGQVGNRDVCSVNPVVGETNDGLLNNIRRRTLAAGQILTAIRTAECGPVQEGTVGAGTGTVAFGWKGGIGTSSRVMPDRLGGYTVGVLVQSNFGGVLQILGVPVGQELGQYYLREAVNARSRASLAEAGADGSIMIVVATDAPLSDRNLTRLAWRALSGLARTGASMSNGSGDYVIAFSTAEGARRTPERRSQVSCLEVLPNEETSPLFQGVIEATEEAVYNSLFMATTLTGYKEVTVEALALDRVLALMHKYGHV